MTRRIRALAGCKTFWPLVVRNPSSSINTNTTTTKSLALMDDKQMTEILLEDGRILRQGRDSLIILDGYPRTANQARLLDGITKIDHAFMLDIDKACLAGRVADRWVHPASGRTYSRTFNAPKVDGLDDLTGEPLARRVDDASMEKFEIRYQAFASNKAQIIAHYSHRAHILKGTTSLQLYAQIKAILDRSLQSNESNGVLAANK